MKNCSVAQPNLHTFEEVKEPLKTLSVNGILGVEMEYLWGILKTRFVGMAIKLQGTRCFDTNFGLEQGAGRQYYLTSL